MTDSAPERRIAVLDACVLYPLLLRDTLLRGVGVKLFRPIWSTQIIAELRRSLLADAGVAAASVERMIVAMDQTFPAATVAGFDHLVASLRNHPRGRHVLAAAIVAKAQVIVTSNVKDFRDPVVESALVRVQTPDEFLCDLLESSPIDMLRILHDQTAALRRPALSVIDVIDGLARQAPDFASRVRVSITAPS